MAEVEMWRRITCVENLQPIKTTHTGHTVLTVNYYFCRIVRATHKTSGTLEYSCSLSFFLSFSTTKISTLYFEHVCSPEPHGLLNMYIRVQRSKGAFMAQQNCNYEWETRDFQAAQSFQIRSVPVRKSVDLQLNIYLSQKPFSVIVPFSKS